VTRWPPRKRPPAGAVPERLVRFVPAEWPAGEGWASYRAWKAARHAWHAEHVVRGGIGPLGDFIDMLRCERATRQRLLGPPR
jgi:hypothetical protein